MIKEGLGNSGSFGNIMALFCAISFSCYIIIVRKYKDIDMIPTSLISGIILAIVTFVVSKGNIFIPVEDFLLCFFWGSILHGFLHSVFIFATRFLLASEVTLFMLLEFSLGPFWVWIFLNESISQNTLFGGLIVMLSVTIYSIYEVSLQKNTK